MADSHTHDLSIAIIGMAVRFPGAADAEQFWRNLRDGVESIERFDEGEREGSIAGQSDADDPTLVRAGGFLADVERFDAAFFDFNPREAEITDPQQRIFLECSWEALERAGYDPESFPGAIGVFAGAGMNTYFFNNVLAHPELFRTVGPFQIMVGTDKDYLAPRVSYKLNLKGPSVSVQTACSTSLVAIHLACQSLQDFQSDLALAGGVSVRAPQRTGYRYTEGGIYSPDGYCRVFDRDALGTVGGNGAGVVVLKRLEDALADGDEILAVIRGTAINNDGAAKVGFTAPSVEGQVAVISEALSVAGVPAESIGYVEAHGTGTALGDPIEVTALNRAFGLDSGRRETCALGSVKSNIGHLDTASGVAGLVKAVMALRNGEIPASLHFQAPNPEIDFAAGPFYVNAALREWSPNGSPRRAGVSSFGIGGTNAHAIVEEAPALEPSGPSRPWQLLLISARTPTALETATDNLARHLEEHPEQSFADVAFTTQVGRQAFKHRRALVCHGREDAAAALRARDPHRVLTLPVEDRDRPVAFLFPGQGAQYPDMGRDLYDSEPAFREALDACARGLRPHLGLDLRTVLYPDGDRQAAAERLERTELAQPALFAVEYAMAALLREWGIRPAAMLGHSIGEYVAACLAGVFSLEDALALVAARGRLMQGLPSGAMLVVPRPEEEARRWLEDGLSLAAVNGPSFSVISGPADRVDALARRLEEAGIEGRRLHTSHAFHSSMMDPVLDEFAREVGKARLSAPKIPYISNLTGSWIEASQATDPAYWVRHLRETVRFGDGAAELLRDRSRILLEVGPGRTLASLVRSAAADRTVATTMRHPQDAGDGDALANGLARLWLAGARIDWAGFHAHERRRRVLLPTYPFERQRFWLEPAQARAQRAAAPVPVEAAASEAAAPAGEARPARQAAQGHPRPALATPFVAPADEVEAAVARLWELGLGLSSVGVHDDFFELGGHSLLATQITAEVRSRFGLDVPLRTLFETPTVAGLAAVVREARQAKGDAEEPAGPALPVVVADLENRHEPFPLTDVQQAYWIGRSSAFELGQVATHIYRETNLRKIDIHRLELAWRRMIERHDMLRAIVLPDGRQQILDTVPPYRIEILDLRGKDPAEKAMELDRVRRQMAHQMLPADRWPLFEIRASILDDAHIRFHVSFDFLIGDAWSLQIMGRDLTRFYRDPEAPAAPLELSFRDYVQAMSEFERTAAFERDLAYWRGRLADLPPAPELPLTKSPAALGRPRFVRCSGGLSRRDWDRLKERANRAGLTASGVLLAAFSEVLAAWSKSPRLTINLTLFNRLPVHRQVNEVVGDFTSLTLLAVDTSGPESFEARAKRTQAQLWEDLDHRSVSGVRVLRELARTGLARAVMPVVFTSTLGLTTRREDEASADADDRPPREDNDYEISQTPQVWLDHQVGELRGRLKYNWDYVDDLFPAGFIQDMARVYQGFIERLAREDEPWGAAALALLPEAQLAQRLEINATGQSFGPAADELLHTLVAPPDDRPAVAAPGRTLTYREIHRRFNALGAGLREAGARPNTLVGVVMEKGWEQVVGTLGILASGAAYLPIDPDLPADRRRYLLENGEVEMVVTQPWVDDRIAEAGEWPEGIRRFRVEEEEPVEVEPFAPVQKPEDLAYVIYTSGSTGQPKGVVIDHRGAVNTILDLNHRFRVGPEDRVFALSSLSFDLSVYDIFGTLAAGGTIVFPEAGRRRDPEHWAERIESEGVTLWSSVPALMEMLAEQASNRPAEAVPVKGSIRLVFLSGDWIPVSLPARIRTLPYVTPDVEVISMGGATEASIWSIIHPIGEVEPGSRSIPYGRPMANQTFHVLDSRLRPRPVWVPGNLYIGGVGLAKGYWRDPAKTAASFITHPGTGERLYRTGDLGRYLPGGDIEFLGREDSQVKIRGYRVELGEIESILASHPQIRDAVVVAREGGAPGEKRLSAYVVAEPESGLDIPALRAFLRERLPEYMVPAGFLFMDALPLTANGKVDRRALPVFDQGAVQSRREYVAPSTEVEEALASICAETLGVEKLGIHDDFFELGGDSLMAIRAIFRIRKAVGVDLQVKSFFDSPTVAGLAEAVEALILDQIENLSDEEVHELL
ncbi:MAG TPA: amino acid adenylation domain-containing protein [Thermoanaerobaculia bacterium]